MSSCGLGRVYGRLMMGDVNFMWVVVNDEEFEAFWL
jgi:hypothetical protein